MQRDNWLPKDQRKTILFLGDDMRVPSGIGTMTKEIVEGTCHYYNWVQLGAAIVHPDIGNIINLSDEVSKHTGVQDPSVIIYPYNGYGDPFIIRRLMKDNNFSALIHFTDPRYWVWLYEMEHEIRQKMPIFFYTIWDNLPYPMYNREFYRSCDWLACISKQTYNIVKQVRADKDPLEPWQLTYIPHGINPEKFFRVESDSDSLKVLRKKLFGDNEYEFILYYNSRNIRRKQTSDIILAFDHFVEKLPEDKKKSVALLLHTNVVEEAGTNLLAVVNHVTPRVRNQVYFYPDITDQSEINLLYNIADVTINISSNEGFGLSIAESLMTETPVIVNVTGGLQDQCGFKDEEGNYLDPDTHFTVDWGSNHDGKYTNHGEWVIPIFPSNRSLQGSPPTPFIFDDRCKWEDVSDAIMEFYMMSEEERNRRGKLGREFCLGPGGLNSENMCNLFMKHMDVAMEKFVPKKPFVIEKV